MTERPDRLPKIVLAPEEDVALARAVEAGVYAAHLLATRGPDRELDDVVAAGAEASARLWWAGARVAAHLAHQVVRQQRLPLEELIQDAYLALTEAVRGYDHARGMRFTSYVYQCVAQALADAYRHRPGVLPPTRGDHWAASLAKAERDRLAQLGVHLTLSQAADAVGVSTTAAARGIRPPISLGVGWCDEVAADPGDDLESHGTDFLALLSPTHAHILAAHYGIGRRRQTLTEIAADLGRSPSTVGRWEANALAQARAVLTADRTTACLAS